MDINKYIGNKIRELRERKNLTQEDLAEYLNTTSQTISRYEIGDRKTNQDILFKLAEYFKISINDFYGLKISGDSMYPKYNENDIVIFERTEDFIIANNKDCAVMVNGFDATFKNVTISENGITLVPFNLNNSDGYKPTFYSKEQISELPVRIVGIAREKRTRL